MGKLPNILLMGGCLMHRSNSESHCRMENNNSRMKNSNSGIKNNNYTIDNSRVCRRKNKIRHRKNKRMVVLALIAIIMLIGYSFKDKWSMQIQSDGELTRLANNEKDTKTSKDSWQLILVNGEMPLVRNYNVKLKKVQNNHQADERVADYLIDMIVDAKNDGVSLLICSSYRSVSRQEELYDNEVSKYVSAGKTMDEALAEATFRVAIPGHSEHNTGLAFDIVTPDYQILDINFEKTDTFMWLNANAQKYGFILRYPKDKTDITKIKYEPWHYRFVGVDNAKKINDAGVCLEEYVLSRFIEPQ